MKSVSLITILHKLSDEKYKNSSKDWRNRYNATLVVPIKNQPDGKDNTVYYGFLTVDSLNQKNQELFSSDDDSPILNILAHAADALAIWFIKNDNHHELLEKTIEMKKHFLLDSKNHITNTKQNTI